MWLQSFRLLDLTRSPRLRYNAVAIALAVTAVIRLIAPAPGSDAAQDLRLQSRFAGTFLRQPATPSDCGDGVWLLQRHLG